MWWSARRALSRALDEIEQLRRDVDALKYDLEDAKQRIQRLMWRSTRASTTTGTSAEPAPGAADTVSSTSGDTAAVSASAGHGTTADPISARLLARRGRLPGRFAAGKLVTSGCADHVAFEDGRPCPNCGQGAFASE